jgi:hypothetical protein
MRAAGPAIVVNDRIRSVICADWKCRVLTTCASCWWRFCGEVIGLFWKEAAPVGNRVRWAKYVGGLRLLLRLSLVGGQMRSGDKGNCVYCGGLRTGCTSKRGLSLGGLGGL